MNSDKYDAAIFPPDIKPYGLTYAEWAARWWQMMFSIPIEDNPAIVKHAQGKIRKQLSAEPSASANQGSNSTLALRSIQLPVAQIATDLGPTPYLSNVTNELRNLKTYSAPSTGVLEFTQAMSPQTREIYTVRIAVRKYTFGSE